MEDNKSIIYYILDIVFGLLKQELTEDIFLSFMQFVKFGIVGISNTIISCVLYAVSLLGMQHSGIFQKQIICLRSLLHLY